MTTDILGNRWIKINALLHEALALPAEHRGAWLETLEGADQDLREVLRRLLEVQAGRDFTALAEQAESTQFVAGELVGPYRLLRELGVGGMGAVWLAVRDDACESAKVALKLPRVTLGAELLRRVQRERDILSTLHHPHIASLQDAGLDRCGRPYLALQHVQGLRIDAHCEREQLDTPARVSLFMQVIDAVQHAHTRWVIHRDLKPSNVLVDARGAAMLLDFGIAALFDEPDLVARSAMTPRYASPEQIQGRPLTAASDIYSLGVMLHELLTGESPYALANDGPLAWANCVIDGHFRHDLPAVFRKALAHDPLARFASAAAFAEELARVF